MKEHKCERMKEYVSEIYYSELHEQWRYTEHFDLPEEKIQDSQTVSVLFCPLCGIELGGGR